MDKSIFLPPYRLSALGKNLGTVHNYLKDTFAEKKKGLADGLHFFKEELSGTTGKCIDLVTLPINNFLKDVGQIEKEFKEEFTKSTEYCICLDGEMVPASEVLSRYTMEENY